MDQDHDHDSSDRDPSPNTADAVGADAPAEAARASWQLVLSRWLSTNPIAVAGHPSDTKILPEPAISPSRPSGLTSG